MFHGGRNVVTGELVTVGLYIGNTRDFQVGFGLREPGGEDFIVASVIDQFEVSFYGVEVACVRDVVCVDGYTSRTGADELGSRH